MTLRPDTERFQLLVVGGGKGGKTLAVAMAREGWRVAMVERVPEMVGGTCINLACIPSKTLIRSAEVAELARRSGEFGIDATVGVPDAALVLARKERVVRGMRAMNLKQFQTSGMELVFGIARFVGPRRVEVTTAAGDTRLLEGEHAVINLGSRPALPAIEGLAQANPMTSESLLELHRIPERLLILGGGYVAVELSQAMHRLGSRVTIVARGPQLLSDEDEDVAADVTEILRQDGIEIHLGTRVQRVERAPSGAVRADVLTDTGALSLSADDLLAALGRTPNTERIGLAEAGVDVTDRGLIKVDEYLRTSEPRTFAVGDVNGGPQFTHVSLDDHRVLKDNLHGGRRTTSGRLIPYCVFIDPELGRVGMTEREARAAGHDVRVARMPASAVPRAQTLGETRGTFKAIVERGTDRILGAAILGAHGGEVIATIQMAMLGGLPFGALRDGVIAHPTMAEGLNQLFSSWVD